MAKFNVRPPARVPSGPIRTEPVPSGRTHEGAPGHVRDARSELFLLGVASFAGEDTFYEKGTDRDDRFGALITQLAPTDPEWVGGFLRWLRADGNIRSTAIAGAAAAARARLTAGQPGHSRQIVASVLQRADEPGELLAYWVSRYGRAIPKPVKRGVADAVRRLYTERALLKYDTASHGFRFGDVIDLVHPTAATPTQGALFRHALDRRHGHDQDVTEALRMVSANRAVRALVAQGDYGPLLSASTLAAAGMTWEDALSLAGAKVNKAQLWQALIPSMGYMALLRNLRNFDEAGIPDDVADDVAKRLADPAQVAASRQFPYRFLAAQEQAPSQRWGHALDKALTACLTNLPDLPGRTLILVDTSASMTGSGLSAKSKMTPAKAAAVFGVALAAKNGRADLYGFADGVFRHEVPVGGSVLRAVQALCQRTGEVGFGTRIAASLHATYHTHQRVVIISDMQTMDAGVSAAVPPTVPIYGFNLGGYRHTPYATDGTRHEFGGLTDATFRLIPLLERGTDGDWPWLDTTG
jgi:hypothetical protein